MPLSLLNHSALALFAQRTRIPTSARSIGFCAIWVCISSSTCGTFLGSRILLNGILCLIIARRKHFSPSALQFCCKIFVSGCDTGGYCFIYREGPLHCATKKSLLAASKPEENGRLKRPFGAGMKCIGERFSFLYCHTSHTQLMSRWKI